MASAVSSGGTKTMSRKSLVLIAILFLLVLGGSTGGVYWSLVQVPEFYQRLLVAEADPVLRKEEAEKLVQRTLRLVDDIKHAATWSEEFTQTQVNSWLAEELNEEYADLIPEGLSDPRVQFSKGSIQIGFRFEQRSFKGVVSLRVKAWVPSENQLAFEIESVRAGLLPIPLEEVFDQVARRLERSGWQVEWTQSDGNDVLVFQLNQAGPNQPVLEQVEVLDKAVRVSGRREQADDTSTRQPPRVAGRVDF